VPSLLTSAQTQSSAKNAVLGLFIVAILIIVASYFMVLLMGLGFIFFTKPGVALTSQSLEFPVLLLFILIGFYVPANAGAVFAFIWIIFVLCFVTAWKWRESFHSAVAKSFSRPLRNVFNNFLFVMPLLSSMLLVAVTVIIYLQNFVGFPTGSVQPQPGEPAQEFFLSLAYAPLTEELGFRLVPLGIFTAIIVFSARMRTQANGVKLFITSFIYPEGAKRMVGLRNVTDHGFWRGISRGEWSMILIASAVFAYAHIATGVGWEIGKVSSVFVQALFFGTVYVAYGFGAPILLHWFFNYYLYFFDPGVLSAWFPSTEPVLSIAELVLLALGTAGWVVFAFTAARRRWKRTRSKELVPAPAVPPAPPNEPATLPS
jgi:hypothetical protein